MLNIKETDRILVVAPHPDDESIGCGGLIASYGRQCDVLLVTDGYNRKTGDPSIAGTREKEFIRAMELAGVGKYTCLRIPEGEIPQNSDKIKAVDLGGYKYVFVPNKYENHRDHRAVYKAFKRLTGGKKRPVLCEYEVWTALRETNLIHDISAVAEKKIDMIKCHESQIGDLDYVGMIMGLAAYRGRQRGMEYAEAYYSKAELKAEKRRHFRKKIKKFIK